MHKISRSLKSLSLSLLLSACGSPARTNSPLVFEDPAQESSAEPVKIATTRTGVIAARSLHQTLDDGVGQFLRRIEVEAQLENGKFAGWRILSFDNPWVDLQAGDIVSAVNGQSIETPAQTHALWQSLRQVREIVVPVVRGTATFELRFKVQGQPTPQ